MLVQFQITSSMVERSDFLPAWWNGQTRCSQKALPPGVSVRLRERVLAESSVRVMGLFQEGASCSPALQTRVIGVVVAQGTFNPVGEGSNPSWPTLYGRLSEAVVRGTSFPQCRTRPISSVD